MEWQTPKTDWKVEDTFYLDRDYRRIRGNLDYLRNEAARVVGPVAYTWTEWEQRQVPLASFFNQVEENLAAAAEAVQQRTSYQTRQFGPEIAVWDWRDLNRIESMTRQIALDLKAIEQGQAKLAFCLGGGLLGSYL